MQSESFVLFLAAKFILEVKDLFFIFVKFV